VPVAIVATRITKRSNVIKVTCIRVIRVGDSRYRLPFSPAYAGFALAYNLSTAVFGGTAPMVSLSGTAQ
jgi:hypothetical protein